MGPLLVVEGQISPNPFSGLSPILVCLQVHLLVLDAAPQPFHEDVVHAPAPAVHAHLNALRQQHAGEGLAGERAALVGVEDLWPTLAQGLFQSRNTEVYLQGVGQPPGQHVAAKKWLRKSEQGDKWNRCLIEGMIVLSETGARDEQTTPP